MGWSRASGITVAFAKSVHGAQSGRPRIKAFFDTQNGQYQLMGMCIILQIGYLEIPSDTSEILMTCVDFHML